MYIYDNVTLNNLRIRKGSEYKIVEKIEKKTHFIFVVSKIVTLWYKVEKLQNALLRLHYNDCANSPQRYAIPPLLVLSYVFAYVTIYRTNRWPSLYLLTTIIEGKQCIAIQHRLLILYDPYSVHESTEYRTNTNKRTIVFDIVLLQGIL
jgi:hypothetical protein